MPTPSRQLKRIYSVLFKSLGPQHWWPGDTPFEVMVGAILTQNTNWGNVEKAIRNLKKAGRLTPRGLKTISERKLAALIKPSGYYNIKAKRLKNFIAFLYQEFGGNLSRMKQEPLPVLREKILSVKGIGPETADSILLYGLGKPVFVIDAYTKRILSRHGLAHSQISYHDLQKFFMDHLTRDQKFFNEYHALLVAAGKNYCRPAPRCEACPIHSIRCHGQGMTRPVGLTAKGD